MKKLSLLGLTLLPTAAVFAAPVVHFANPLKAVEFSATELNPIIFPGKLYSASGVIVNVGATTIDSGRIKVVEDIPAGTTVTGSYQAQLPGGFATIDGSNGGIAYIYSPAYNYTDGHFTFPASEGEQSIDDLQIGMTIMVQSGNPAGRYTGTVPVLIQDSLGHSTTLNLNVNFVYLAADTISTQRDMVFPPVTVGSSGTLYNISPANVGAAVFSASGSPGTSATVSVVNPTVNLTKAGTSKVVQVYGFSYGGSASATGVINFPSSGASSGLVNNIRVGATAYYEPNLLGGIYTGTNTIRITY